MVDWKKEIKLSDLVGRGKDDAAAAPGAPPEPESTLEADVAAAVELVKAYAPAAGPSADEPPASDEAAAAPAEESLAFLTAELPGTLEADAAAPEPVEPETDPVVVHPPVPSAALPPLEDEAPPKRGRKATSKPDEEKGKPGAAEATVPFYKRELSFGRKTKAPKARKEPKAEQPKVEAKPRPKAKAARRTLSVPRPQARAGKGKQLVGLKIGGSQLAAATVANNGHAEVVQVARTPLERGIVQAGELREPERLAEALKEFFKAHKLPKRGVRLGIATNRIGVRTLEITGIEDPKQLANAIRFRAQEALPIPIDEAVLDYQVLSETRTEDGESVRKILLVLAYRDLIDRYVGACKQAGIQLAGIDLEAFALLRAVAAPREADAPQAALVAVTVGHDRTTFAVSDGRVCEFTRVLDWGGHALDVAVARALDIAPSDAEVFKRGLSLETNAVPDGLTDEQAQRAREALRRQVQTFARELVSSLQFYQGQPGSLGIGEIILTGGTAHLGGFGAELERLIGVRVRLGDPLVRVKVGKRVEEPEQLGSLAVAIGLGIED